MRICVITSAKFPPEEGLGNYIYNMSRELIQQGHEVTVITRGRFSATQYENFNGIHLYRATYLPVYPFHVHFHGLFVKRLFDKLKSNFDIVHFHTPLPPVIRTSLPIITTVHSPVKTSIDRDPNPLTVKLQSKISYRIERAIFHMSDLITCVSSSVSEELRDYRVNPSDVVVIGNGVNEKLYYPAECEYREKYILFAGRITYQKGITDFIECALKLCPIYPDINFKIAGKGPLSGEMEEKIKSAGYEGRFKFVGHIGHEEKQKLIELYRNAYMFILPSHYEGLPTTLLEAMACGLPVVSTAVSGSLDVIEEGKNGLLIPVSSPGEMEKAIISLIEDDEKRVKLGREARATIESRYSWDRISDKIIKCYGSIVEAEHKK